MASDSDDKMREFEEMCSQGSSEGCHSLAEYLQLIKGDVGRAMALFEQNCDPPVAGVRRYGPSCFAVASLLARNEGGPHRDRNLAPQYFEKACAAGSVEACSNLGLIYRSGMFGVTKDDAKSCRFYEQACRGGDGKACFGAGTALMRQNQNIGSMDILEYFEKACILGYPYGCSNASVMLTRGEGNVPVDMERAQKMRSIGEELARTMGLQIAGKH